MCLVWAGQLRRIALELSGKGRKEVGYADLYAAMGAADAATRERVRRTVNHMVQRGEMERVSNGLFRVAAARLREVARSGKSYQRMWKIIRTERAGWSIGQVAGTTSLHPSTVSQYCNWLLAEGFIAECGKRDKAVAYRATEKAAQHPATPFPPVKPDPYARERDAAARLARLFMGSPSAHQEEIAAQCRVILARFSQNENFSDNVRTGGEG